MEQEVKTEILKEEPTKASLDELYFQAKMKKRKIGYLVGIIVSFVLALTIIIMASIRIDLRPKFVSEPDDIIIYTSEVSSQGITMSKGEEAYKSFEQVYNGMFNISFLSAMFTGHLGGYKIEETVVQFPEVQSGIKELIGENYVMLHYENAQTFYTSSGNAYNSIYSDDYSLTFNDVYFGFSQDNQVQDMTFYFKVKGNIGKDKFSITKITIKANTHPIYEKLDDFRDKPEV